MKAYVLKAINEFAIEEVEKPVPGRGQVLMKVMAAGICGSDIPRIYRAGTYSYPLIPGHEFAGYIEGVGEDVDASYIGKRMGVFPLVPCGDCEPCKCRKYEMCRKYSYLGSRCNGAFAEYIVVPVWNLIELPDEISYETAAMLEPMCVAAHAVRAMNIKQEETVAICGMGTIGMLVLMLLRAQGCEKIFAIGNKEFQRKLIMDMNIPEEYFCNSKEENVEEWLKYHTCDRGVDVFFECVGKNESIALAIEAVCPAGRIQLVGNPHSDMVLNRNVYWKILRNQLVLKGTWNSSFTQKGGDDWNYVIRLLKEGKLKPEKLITHRFSFDRLMQGFEIMRDKAEEYIKVMGKFENVQ